MSEDTPKHTPGPWKVRKLVKDGELADCFVAAPSFQGFPYDSEVLGDDEYGHSDGDTGIQRKLSDCNLIAAAPDMLRILKLVMKDTPEFADVCDIEDVIARADGEKSDD